MRRLAFTLALLALASCRTMAPMTTGFLDRTATVNGRSYPYVVYVPRRIDLTQKTSVVLFLHGSGERGSDGLKPSQVGLGSAIRFESSRVPAIVVFPQVPENERWIGEPADAAMAALENATTEFNGDRARTYLTGLSMGGYGAIHLALANPQRFAAMVVVCGGLFPHPNTTSVRLSPLIPKDGDAYAFVAQSLHHIPVWLFHGADDPVIPVDESRQLHEALVKAGADVHYTEYPGVGHNAWDRAYEDGAMLKWLFSKELRR